MSQRELQIFGEREKSLELVEELLRGNVGVSLSRLDVAMSQHSTHRFNRNASLQSNQGGKGMPPNVENTFHLRNWKNIENKLVTGCELADFLYSASVIGKQFGTEY